MSSRLQPAAPNPAGLLGLMPMLAALLDPQRFKQEWFSHVRADLIAGVVVALALIPEAIAFSLIAGVEPKVGLYASFTIAVTAALFGGRPGMISAATGAMALLVVPLVAKHGVQYLFAATVLTGLIQLAFRALRLSRYIKFVPKPVMTGFVNALAILIFMAQVPQVLGQGWVMYGLVVAGLVIIYGLPRLTKAVPSALVALVTLSALTVGFGIKTHTVGDMGALPNTLPSFGLPSVPLTWETLRIIAPYAFPMAMVGLIESLLTAKVVDEMTDTPSCKHGEAYGQGLANIVTGFFGGMAGCAMIGQSVINVRSGGRGRLSTFSAGIFLLFFLVVLGDFVAMIPTGALVAVMVMVSVGTFDWGSLRAMRVMPRTESVVMVATVAVVVVTHDLFLGVLSGVLLSAVFFARSVDKLLVVEQQREEGGELLRYVVRGQLFFVSTEQFVAAFELNEAGAVAAQVEIELSQAHVWDASAVAALDYVVLKLRSRGVSVRVVGANMASAALISKLGQHEREDAVLAVGH